MPAYDDRLYVPPAPVARVVLRHPERAERVAGYLSKYLAKWKEDGSCEVTETVLTAGRSYLNYVSRKLTAQSRCTMRNLRNARRLWASRNWYVDQPRLQYSEWLAAAALLAKRREIRPLGP